MFTGIESRNLGIIRVSFSSIDKLGFKNKGDYPQVSQGL
jgi:hypothetical protein